MACISKLVERIYNRHFLNDLRQVMSKLFS